MSQLYNSTQDYSPKILNEAARALNLNSWELLMRPEEAMALRRLREDAIRIASEERLPYKAEIEEPSERLRNIT